MEYFVTVKVRQVGSIGVDGGSFIIVDPVYLDILSSRNDTPERIKAAVEEWYGFIAQWGDGDYPIFEVLGVEDEIVGVLVSCFKEERAMR